MSEDGTRSECHDDISLDTGEEDEELEDMDKSPSPTSNKNVGNGFRNISIIGRLNLICRQITETYEKSRVCSGLQLSTLIAGLIAMLLLLTVVIVASNRATPPSICHLDGCIDEGTRLSEVMNRSVSPCDDFYKFACGKFKSKGTTGRHSIYSIINALNEKNHLEIERMMIRLNSNYPSTAIQKLSKFYKTCIRGDPDPIAFTKLKMNIMTLGGWDLMNNFNSSKWNIDSQLSSMAENHPFSHILSLHYYHRFNAVLLYPPDYILNFFQTREFGSRTRKTLIRMYTNYVTHILTLVQTPLKDTESNQTCGSKCQPSFIANDIITMDNSIAEIWNDNKNKNLKILTQAELRAHAPSIEWRRILRAKLGNTAINQNARIVVPGLTLLQSLDNLVKTTNASTWNNYMMWTFTSSKLMGLGDVVSTYYRKFLAFSNFDGMTYYSRDRLCYSMVATYMPLAVRALVLHELIGKDNVKQAKKFYKKLHQLAVSSISWMPQPLHKEAMRRLSTFHVDFNTVKLVEVLPRLDYHYLDLQIGTNLFDNLALLNIFHSKERRLAAENAGTRSSDDSTEYLIDDSFKVSLTWFHYSNTLHVPPSTLQIPMYNRDLPFYLNAAALGSRILSLALYSVYFYSNGSAWDSSSIGRAKSYQKCLVNNFKNYKLGGNSRTDSEGPDGDDFGGLSRSISFILQNHLAFSTLEGTDMNQEILPGEDVSSSLQQFYLAYAQSKCETAVIEKKDYLLQYRFPHREMVNNFVYNSPQFMEAYQCGAAPDEHKGSQCVL